MNPPKSALVKEMNKHLGTALSLIEDGAADNNALIREEMKLFFARAEKIEKEIAEFEVASINKVKQSEMFAIEDQKAEVVKFLTKFDEKINQIEDQIRNVLGETSPLLNC
ncbi:hypothetical protein TRFO_07721 [Tritrichomonas foetus]|uniref:Uncharacterized protein n=1 Tax=Tritrichomonas foetus TaxID=1144522 RepID=A0A1J4JUW0_9EUKA|nr:hypothetical protein TRFO_07721 [Tritrichomonas foetus]|eukprot:OHT01045.1 hypothetical protein TRFO_07721 [Tritrichomonas foetus]